jgi:hypothetical protein
VVHLLHSPAEVSLPRGLQVSTRTDGNRPSFPGIERFWKNWLVAVLTSLHQPDPQPVLHFSEPGFDLPCEVGGWNLDVVRMATTVKNMESLRTASLALEQLPPYKCLACHMHKAG